MLRLDSDAFFAYTYCQTVNQDNKSREWNKNFNIRW